MYEYALAAVPWLGPFARFRLATQLFPTHVVRAQDSEIFYTDREGKAQDPPAGSDLDAMDEAGFGGQDVAANERVEITAAFEPLILRQTAGAFAKPYDGKKFTLNMTVGGGAEEVITADGYVVDKVDDKTNFVTVKQLHSYQQIGVELEAVAGGALADNASWQLSANVLHPFKTNPEPEKKGTELTNIELGAKLALRLSSWASVDYVFSAKRIPLVVEEWQLQHNLLFTAAFSIM